MTEDSPENKRPSRMINVAFPPAKYGLWIAIALICSILLLRFIGVLGS